MSLPAQNAQPPLTESAFYMLRCLVAVATADNVIEQQELVFLRALLAHFKRHLHDSEQRVGVTLTERVPLVLNGAGLRTRFMLEVYVVGLYVRTRTTRTTRTTRADAVLDAREPRRVRLVMKRAVDAQTIWDNFNEGIRTNASGAELSALEPRLVEVERAFRAIGAVAKGDEVDIDLAADGTGVIRYRGEEQGVISSAELSRALLKIWLGAKPVQDDLKRALLGG